MIRINLLPFRAARKKENIKRQISLFLITLVVVSVGIYFYSRTLNNKIGVLDTRIAETRQEIEKYKKITVEIAKIKKDLDVLNKKIEVINGLERNRKEPVRLLEAMTQLIIAKRMWFENFSAAGNTVQMNGVALDNKTVADFMTRLEGSGLFKGVGLGGLRKKAVQNLNLKSFQITCEKAPFQEPAASEAKK